MNNTSLFEFAVDQSTRTVVINMVFEAEHSLVWDAFTTPELLDQWYAPKPMVSKTKFMDFRVGGRRFYAMVTPEGQEFWSIQKYTSITPKTNFKMFNAFADKDENPQLPGSDWDLSFSPEAEGETGERTKVTITVVNESQERFDNLLEPFKAGFKMTYENLKNLLASLSVK